MGLRRQQGTNLPAGFSAPLEIYLLKTSPECSKNALNLRIHSVCWGSRRPTVALMESSSKLLRVLEIGPFG